MDIRNVAKKNDASGTNTGAGKQSKLKAEGIKNDELTSLQLKGRYKLFRQDN